MAVAATSAGVFVAIAVVLISAFPDKASDPRPGFVIPVVAACVGIALVIIIGIAWAGSASIRAATMRGFRQWWRRGWMPGGLREAHLTKKYGEKARVTKGSWTELTVGANTKDSWTWVCPYCLAENTLSEFDCIGCGAVLDFERERVKLVSSSRTNERGGS